MLKKSSNAKRLRHDERVKIKISPMNLLLKISSNGLNPHNSNKCGILCLIESYSLLGRKFIMLEKKIKKNAQFGDILFFHLTDNNVLY